MSYENVARQWLLYNLIEGNCCHLILCVRNEVWSTGSIGTIDYWQNCIVINICNYNDKQMFRLDVAAAVHTKRHKRQEDGTRYLSFYLCDLLDCVGLPKSNTVNLEQMLIPLKMLQFFCLTDLLLIPAKLLHKAELRNKTRDVRCFPLSADCLPIRIQSCPL